jgi:hypothetical protein
MGLFKSSNDTAAHLMAHAHLEEGPGVFKHLTDANNRNKGRKS